MVKQMSNYYQVTVYWIHKEYSHPTKSTEFNCSNFERGKYTRLADAEAGMMEVVKELQEQGHTIQGAKIIKFIADYKFNI